MADVTQEPTGGQRNHWTMTFLTDGGKTDDGLLEVGSHYCVNKKGQGKLMGSICCTQIPFIFIKTSQSHLSPLLDHYSVNPQTDPKTHTGTDAIVLFPLS